MGTAVSVSAEVRKKARQFGFALSDAQVEYIVWSKTGYPCFWPRPDKTPLQNFQKQLYDFFAFARRVGLSFALSAEEEDRYYQQGPQ
jgi:hypothetical protein